MDRVAELHRERREFNEEGIIPIHPCNRSPNGILPNPSGVLFGVDTNESLQNFVHRMLNDEAKLKKDIWNFDFCMEKPITEGEWVWITTASETSMPGGTDKNQEEEIEDGSNSAESE